jgi:galactokinase
MITKETLNKVYGQDAEEAQRRFQHVDEMFLKSFGAEAEAHFTAPGRTEIIGNHTDHNGGRILAASVTLDTIAGARKRDDGKIRLISENYSPDPFEIDVNHREEIPKDNGTISLLGGMLEALVKMGYQVGGFDAYVTTNVVSAAGISSSASFEMLVITILNTFYNDGKIDYASYARAGQYAENVYWHKASGLMDQMACACGGTILLDFSHDVRYERVNFTFEDIGCREVLINTGKGHSDLSAEYSSIPDEMRRVAGYFGKKNLCEVNEEDVLSHIAELRKQCGDRAVLRAMHYFEECGRVDQAAEAVKEGHVDQLLQLIDSSGRSSFEWLQNAYVAKNPEEQSVPMALMLSEIYMKRKHDGVCRLHGGGFGGVMMAVLKEENVQDYADYMAGYFGRENVYITGIRRIGAACLEEAA